MAVKIPKSVLIIGAGIAGLAAGCYAQMNGYRATIFEKHDLPGGMVTSWKRRGFLFDGCIEFLNGSNPGSNWGRLWAELGASRDRVFVEHAELIRVRKADQELILHADPDQLERHLLNLAPGDATLIHELANAVRGMVGFDPPLDVKPLKMLGEMPRFLKWLNTFNHYNRWTVNQFAARFKDPFLRSAFALIMPANTPMGMAIGAIAFQAQRNSGYPVGGSLAFAQAVAQRFCALGGQIFYGSPVEKILTEPAGRGGKARAVGVRLRDGREFQADWVISAADGRNTAYDLLEGRFLDQEMKTRYTTFPLTAPALQISLGVRREMQDAPHSLVDLLPQPVYFAGQEHTHFWYHIMNFDPSAAPRGKTVIISRLRSSYDYWHKLAEERSRYEAEKLAVADALIRHLEGRWPGISEQVEAVDVATPLTFERYTNAFQGTSQSFALTLQTARFSAGGFPPELPGLERFYQIGSWLQPGGGVFPSARTGRVAVQRMCRADGRRFNTTIA